MLHLRKYRESLKKDKKRFSYSYNVVIKELDAKLMPIKLAFFMCQN